MELQRQGRIYACDPHAHACKTRLAFALIAARARANEAPAGRATRIKAQQRNTLAGAVFVWGVVPAKRWGSVVGVLVSHVIVQDNKHRNIKCYRLRIL